MNALLADIRFAFRLLLRQPLFTATAVLVLAIGIGANAAVFSVVNTLLLRPLPGVSSERSLLGLFGKHTGRADDYRAFSYPNYVDIRQGTRAFDRVSAFTVALAGITEGPLTRRSFVQAVSSNYFETLGAAPAVGRAFTPEEEQPGQPVLVTVVSHAFWQRHGADPAFIGRTVTLSGRLFTVVGVAPAGFAGTAAGLAPEFWVPLSVADLVENDFMREDGGPNAASRDSHRFMLVGRLKAGVTREAADSDLSALGARLAAAYPGSNRDYTIVSSPLQRMGFSTAPGDDAPVATLSAVLLGMSGIVLLVACLNLANMLLARGTARRKEIAIRLALGAGRLPIVRQLLTEGFLMALAGGAVGLVIGHWAMVLLLRSIGPLMPMPFDLAIGLDWRVTLATLAFAALATVAFALAPALKATRPSVINEIKEQAGEDRGGRTRLFGARNLLLGGQMALSLALLFTGALFVRGAVKAADATPGFSPERGVLLEVDPSLAGYTPSDAAAAHRRLVARLRQLPGVEAASMTSLVPFGSLSESVRVEAVVDTPAGAAPAGKPPRVSASHASIGSDYFRALGMTIVRGREFTVDEAEGTTPRAVAIIDEPAAARLFPARGENPVGRYVRVGSGDAGKVPEVFEVIGVVPGLRSDLFERQASPHIYVPFSGRTRAWMNFHIRVAPGSPTDGAAIESIRRAVAALDPRLPVLSARTLESFFQSSVFLWLFQSGARVFTGFGLAALVLALVGIYGINAYLVLRRTREIGIRMALGATSNDVARLILRDTVVVSGSGIVVGTLLAIGIGRMLGSMLYEVTAFDPVALVATPLLLAAAALAASYLPARRAMRVAPVTALRRE